jgi:ABC-type multidrug transport system permease subunit
MLGTLRIFCQESDDVSEINMRCDSSLLLYLSSTWGFIITCQYFPPFTEANSLSTGAYFEGFRWLAQLFSVDVENMIINSI